MQTTLVFRSNAPDQPEVTVTLSAIDSTDYPIICTCVPNHVETRVGQSLLVSAQCIDAELQPLQYSWTVERRPPHSVARFAMPHSPSASILLDEPTTVHSPYVFLATATDTFGASGSCTITALAPAANAISVQLTTDEDQARLDLHLLNPDGITAPYGPQGWFSSPNDCHVNNPTPDWGALGDERDDPGMAGNALVFTRPAAGLYRVGAHLACADPRGPTTATARVFCGGSLVAEFGPRLLTAEGAFWEIAEVAFPSCRINGLDRVLQHTRACASQDLGEGAFVSADGGS